MCLFRFTCINYLNDGGIKITNYVCLFGFSELRTRKPRSEGINHLLGNIAVFRVLGLRCFRFLGLRFLGLGYAR